MNNYFVTGISKGLGLEITKLLLASGENVYGVLRKMNEEVRELKSIFPEALKIIEFDLEDFEKIDIKLINSWFGKNTEIHGFVNNAAIAYDDLITNLNNDKLLQCYKVNVFAPIALTKQIIRRMLLHRTKGSIIHISSISTQTGYKGLSFYASTKGALEAFSKNTSREWGEFGIRSNCIIAGFMETAMSSSLSSEQKSRIYQRTSLKKPVDILSVSKTVVFLLSENANSITGQNIFVDNGTI